MLLEHRSVNATSQKSLEDFLNILRVDGVAHPSLASKLPKSYAQAEKIVSLAHPSAEDRAEILKDVHG